MKEISSKLCVVVSLMLCFSFVSCGNKKGSMVKKQEEKFPTRIELSKDSQEALEVQKILGMMPAYKIEPNPPDVSASYQVENIDYYDDAGKHIGSKNSSGGGVAGIYETLWYDSAGNVVAENRWNAYE